MVDYGCASGRCKRRGVKERIKRNKSCGARSGTDAEGENADMRRRWVRKIACT